MKSFKNTFFQLSLVLTLSSFLGVSFAGIDSGGGQGVLCGTKLQVLDLYEAAKAGLELPASEDNLKEVIKTYGKKLKLYQSYKYFEETSLHEELEWPYREIKTKVLDKFLDIIPGKKLPFTHDSTVGKLPEGCQLVQLAYYNDRTGNILRNPDYWKMLDTINKAALVLHELLYFQYRSGQVKVEGAIKSDEARKIIGKVFSNKSMDPIFAPLYSKDKYFNCSINLPKWPFEFSSTFGAQDKFTNVVDSKVVEAFIFSVVFEVREGISGMGFYFNRFRDVSVISRHQGFAPGLTLKKLNEGSFKTLSLTVTNAVTSETHTFELSYVKDDKNGSHFKARAQAKSDILPTNFSYGGCKLSENY